MARTMIRGDRDIQPSSISADRFVSNLGLATTQLADGADFLKRDGSVALTSTFNAGNQRITGVANATGATDAVNKSQLDSVKSGFQVHFVRVVAVVNMTLSGVPTVDGVALTAGDRILLTNQNTASQNGIWEVRSGSWTRPSDWAAASVLSEGQYIITEPDGSTYGNSKWFNTNVSAVTVDTTSATFSRDQSGTSYTAGSGLALVGSQFSAARGNGVGLDGSNNLTVTPDPNGMLQTVANGVGIKTGTAAQLLMANSSGNPSYQTMSGDASISAAGAVTVAATIMKYAGLVANEVPSGTINGTNTAFTLSAAPQNGFLLLFVNGMLEEPGTGNDYTISGANITMLYALQTTDKIRAYFIK